MSQGMHLRDLVRALGWSYATLWSIPNLMSELIWADGSFEESPLKKYEAEYWNVESLFTTVYKSCSFKPGSGYAGKALKEGQVLWLTGSDGLIHQTNNFNQAHFFKVAGIQTLLCIPCFNSVVELGSSALVPRNENLLIQIQTFLSRMPSAHATATRQQLLLANASTPIGGPQNILSRSQGQSGSSDNASFNGGANHEVDACSSFPCPAEASGPEDSRSDANRFAATAEPDSLKKIGAGLGEKDWRLYPAPVLYSPKISRQSLKVPSKAPPTVTNSVQQCHEHQQEEVGLDAGFQSSALISPLHLPLFSQLKYNQSISSSHSSSKGDSHDHRKGSSENQRSKSDLSHSSASIVTGFAPWSATKQESFRIEPVQMRCQSSSTANQVMLQRCIKMTHQISHLNSWVDNHRANHNRQVEVPRNDGTGAAATVETADEVLSGHDEAALHHMLAERKRRLKQKENFTALRALIPFVSKMDRASTLEDAINYVNQLKARVTELESLNKALQADVPQKQNLTLIQRKRSKS